MFTAHSSECEHGAEFRASTGNKETFAGHKRGFRPVNSDPSIVSLWARQDDWRLDKIKVSLLELRALLSPLSSPELSRFTDGLSFSGRPKRG